MTGACTLSELLVIELVVHVRVAVWLMSFWLVHCKSLLACAQQHIHMHMLYMHTC